MTDFDIGIIARLADYVSAPSKAIVASMKQMQEAIQKAQVNMASSALRGTKSLEAWANTGVSLSTYFSNAWNKSAGQVTKGWSMITDGASRAYGRISGIIGGIISIFRKLAVWTGLSIAGIGYLIHRTEESIVEQANFAKQVGLNINVLGGLQYAAKMAGISIESFNTSFRYMTKEAGELQTNKKGPIYDFFKANDPNVLNHLLRATPEQFFRIAMAVIKQQKPAVQEQLASLFFGRGGMDLVRMADTDLEGALKKHLKLHGPITQEMLANARRWDEAITNFTEAWDGLKASVLGGASGQISKRLDELTGWMSDEKNRTKIRGWIDDAITKVSQFINKMKEWSTSRPKHTSVFQQIGRDIETIIAPLKWIKDNLGIGWTAGLIGGLLLLGPAVEILAGLGLLLWGSSGIILGLGLVALAGYEIYKHWDKVEPILRPAIDAIKGLKTAGDNLAATIKDLTGVNINWETVFGFATKAAVVTITVVVNELTEAVKGLKAALTGDWEGLFSWIGPYARLLLAPGSLIAQGLGFGDKGKSKLPTGPLSTPPEVPWWRKAADVIGPAALNLLPGMSLIPLLKNVISTGHAEEALGPMGPILAPGAFGTAGIPIYGASQGGRRGGYAGGYGHPLPYSPVPPNFYAPQDRAPWTPPPVTPPMNRAPWATPPGGGSLGRLPRSLAKPVNFMGDAWNTMSSINDKFESPPSGHVGTKWMPGDNFLEAMQAMGLKGMGAADQLVGPLGMTGFVKGQAGSVGSPDKTLEWMRRHPGGGALGPRLISYSPAAPRINASFGDTPNATANLGTGLYGALYDTVRQIVSSVPAQAGANAPITGTPPPGLTIQAKGPSVVVNQAPPNVNIAVTVMVTKPDEAPAVTGQNVGNSIIDKIGQTAMYAQTWEA